MTVLMRTAIALSFIWLLSSPASAQQSPEAKACFDKANTQQDMNACAAADLKRADTDLNRTYQSLLAKWKSDPVAIQKLRAAQRAWIVFRDAHLAELFPKQPAEYGSSYAMSFAMAGADVARQRTKMLNDMLHPKEGDVGSNPR